MGELDLVAELAHIAGQIVVSVSIGKEWANAELPYQVYDTGEIKMLKIGNFLNAVQGAGNLRDVTPLNILFPELLPYLVTPSDRVYK